VPNQADGNLICGSERNRVSTHGDFDRRCSLVILSGVFIRLQVCAFMFLVGFRRGTYRSNGLAPTGFSFLILLSLFSLALVVFVLGCSRVRPQTYFLYDTVTHV